MPTVPTPVSYNDIYGANTAYSCVLGTGNVAADPLFVSFTGGDLHTQPTSPAIYSGDINAPDLPATDLDGKNRTVCGKIDMGVYQHHPQPPIALTASANPSPGGNNVTFTAQLTGNCNVPTGVVTFLDGATPIGTGTLNGSAATSLTTAFLVVGQHAITASYPGDFNFDASTSNAVTETVTGFATATSLAVAPNPARAFQPISLNAAVTAPYGTPSGTVTFLASGNALGTATLNGGGVATLSTGALGAGTYTIVAVFNATTQYASSTSAAVALTVLAVPSATTLTAQPNPIYQGQTVTFSASAAGTNPSPAAATGTISFFDGAALLVSAAIAGGHATFATGALAIGSHSVTAAYTGDGNFAPSGSAPVVEVVLASSFTIGLSPANLAFGAGQPQQVTVDLASVGNYTGTLQLGTGALPLYASATFSPASAQLTPGGTATATLTLLTAAPPVRAGVEDKSRGPILAALIGLPLLLLRRARRPPHLFAVLLSCAVLASLSGCGSVRFAANSVAPGTYTIPVMATDAATGTSQTATLTLQITR